MKDLNGQEGERKRGLGVGEGGDWMWWGGRYTGLRKGIGGVGGVGREDKKTG